MGLIASTFLRGLGVVVPVALTIWIVVWLVMSTERLLRVVFLFFLPADYYLPGLGFALGIGIIYATGILVQVFVIKQLWEAFDRLFQRIPLVKTVYHAISDFLGFFSQKPGAGAKVVRVDVLDGSHLIGFVTDESADIIEGDGLIAVYLPMSYQMGGYTLLVERKRVTAIDVNVEAAMRYVLTAGIQGRGA